MAKLFPALPDACTCSGLQRELDVLRLLQQQLPVGYEIFHSVDWHNLYQGNDSHGEIDLVIMNQAGSLLLVEIKSGPVVLQDGGIFKQYKDNAKAKSVDQQIKVQYGAMRACLNNARIQTTVKNCLVLPDCTLGTGSIIAMARERIFDASDYPDLANKVQQLLPQSSPSPVAQQVTRFLQNRLDIAPDVSTLRLQITTSSRKLADGLATWVPRIQAPSGVIRIQATAGSGKTQLALRLLENAAEQNQRALYVCYNRPLSDHISRLAPAQSQISTFHELCVEHYRRSDQEPDFSQRGIFQIMEQHYLQAMAQTQPRLDLLIIDEAQDFAPEWVNGLIQQLKPDAKLYLMEDENQRLYERDGFDLSDAVQISCHDNFRSPRMLCQAMNALGLSQYPINARSPYEGDAPDFLICPDTPNAMQQYTQTAVARLLENGFGLQDIVILVGHGTDKSVLLKQDKLGPYSLRHFTGRYTADGNPIWTEGELMVESVYRFKGQSAPAIVLSELDFIELNEQERRKLFVGLSRAQLHASLVLSQHAAQALESILTGN